MAKKIKKDPVWDVVGSVTGGKYLGRYRAKTAEEAVEKALNGDENHVSLCHQCSPECEDPQIENATADEAQDDGKEPVHE